MLVACKECGKLIDSKESYCTICGAKRNKKKKTRPKFRPKETKSRDITKETNAKFKKRGVSLFLTFMFGPFGLLYSSFAGALFMIFATFLISSHIYYEDRLLIFWILSMALGDYFTRKHNELVLDQYAREESDPFEQ